MGLMSFDINSFINMDHKFLLESSADYVNQNELPLFVYGNNTEFEEEINSHCSDFWQNDLIVYIGMFTQKSFLIVCENCIIGKTERTLTCTGKINFMNENFNIDISKIENINIYEDEKNDDTYLSINGYLLLLNSQYNKIPTYKFIKALIHVLQLKKTFFDGANPIGIYTTTCIVLSEEIFSQQNEKTIFDFLVSLLKSMRRMEVTRQLFDMVRLLEFEIGYRSLVGKGTEINETEALKYIEASSKKGLECAQTLFGYCLYNGIGLAKNIGRAFVYYKSAADKGDQIAQYNLGLYYLYGNENMEINEVEAFKWFRKSALRGYPDAQNNLATCYYYGVGISSDIQYAKLWYQKAACNGNHLAQYNLANLYYLGNGMTKNINKAVKWYTKSVESGFGKAKDILDIINNEKEQK